MRAAYILMLLGLLLAAAGCTPVDAPAQQDAGNTPVLEAEEASAASAADAAETDEAPLAPGEDPLATQAAAAASAEATATAAAEATETQLPGAASTPISSGTPQPVDEVNAAEIYAAAVDRVYNVEHSFSDPADFPLVYMATNTADGTLLGLPATPEQELDLELRRSIADELADQPFEIIWVESLDEVPQDDGGYLAEGQGIYITVGNIIPQENGTVQVPLHMHCGPLCASGKVYVLEKIEGAWQVTGNVGMVIEA